MKVIDCEAFRDAYPDVLHGAVPADVARVIRGHVASCDECRIEAALLDRIHASAVPLPAGLYERVVQAAARAPRRWQLRRSDLAMAATLAVALIGGTLVMLQNESARVLESRGTAQSQGLGIGGVEDVMLSGKSSLDDLSVEELEKLLGEMES